MRIAVVGSGIAGLVCAHVLNRNHSVDLFEANSYFGGHTHTHTIKQQGQTHDVDSGFIVFNERTYPNFIKLLKQLDVPARPTEMSFSVRADAANFEYNGHTLATLFAQKRNLVRPRFYRMLLDILKFNRTVVNDARERDGITLGQYLRETGFSPDFVDYYLVPMAAAIWSQSTNAIVDYPLTSFVRFFDNHGLLQVANRPQWFTIAGGSHQYVRRIVDGLSGACHLNTPIQSVSRRPGGAVLTIAGQDSVSYDHVIIATHSDQALRLLAAPTEQERATLGSITYTANHGLLHTDTSVLPQRRQAWAAWNYHLGRVEANAVNVTYNMNILQQIKAQHTYCVTLNPQTNIEPEHVLAELSYEHPLFNHTALAAQQKHASISGRDHIHFCGAYWGNGFHEDGVNSALKVCNFFGESL